MEITDDALRRRAVDVTQQARKVAASRKDWALTGYVGAALITDRGNIYTGINVSVYCGIGFCAEHSAIAEMIKKGETRIARVVGAGSCSSRSTLRTSRRRFWCRMKNGKTCCGRR
jgi:cytidine deaminase